MRKIFFMTLLLCTLNLVFAAELRTLKWEEMVPADAAPLPPPQALHNLDQLADILTAESGPGAEQQYPNAPVVPELNGLNIKLPGYIVPLSIDENSRITEFLLVPYFGACIHVPPPPSNQMVYVTSEGGVAMGDIWQPYWIEGRLSVESFSSELGDTGYRAEAQQVYRYVFDSPAIK
ncbi:MAG: DUF3299 domain-containing protein [Pseudomonas sp.]|jgi:hypothetical protein|nr:DUF3299 domain-containing protein [Pseudomonas sp.]MDD2223246.1 DUF3299 domain-containing protein [Pseudomonas sp.]MDY0413828.1 DUF3299 domain-containing protein [Pseudomonas sp.]NLO52958.1 DUF3299 domain-containing protein [Gammaproteobacteria bacterium]